MEFHATFFEEMGHIAGMDVCATLAFIDGLGGPEMVLIFVLILVLFGGQKLPEFARGMGKTVREFKKAAAGVEEEFKRALDEDERKKSVPAIMPPATVAALPENPAPDYAADHPYDDAGPHAVTEGTPAPAPETPVMPAASAIPEGAPQAPSANVLPVTVPTPLSSTTTPPAGPALTPAPPVAAANPPPAPPPSPVPPPPGQPGPA